MTEDESHSTQIRLRPMSSIKDDVPTLAWEPKPGYPGMAVGTLAILGGRPAAGKSTTARYFAAGWTNGTLAGAWYGTPVGVAWIGTEESEVYMIKPGLRAAGADLDKVVIPEVQFGSDDDTVSILHHLDMDGLAEEFRRAGVKVVVLDPLMSAVGARTDVNRSNEVRSRLEPWVKLAEAIDGVVIGIAHLKKSFTGDVVAALNGSSAFGEVARSIFGFAKDDNADDGTRLMSHAKSSFGPEDISYTYTLEPVEVITDSGKKATMSRFVLGEETDRTVADALREAAAGVQPDKPEDKPLTDKTAMLVQILTGTNGALIEVAKDDIVAQMSEAGYSADQTRRAREELSKRGRIGKPYRKGSSGPYYWKLLSFVDPDGNYEGAQTTGGLPSCHSVLDQHVSSANQHLVGKDGKVGNSLGNAPANQGSATVTAIDSRRLTGRAWLATYLEELRAAGQTTAESFAVLDAGAAAGFERQTIRVAASDSPEITVVGRRGKIAIWDITGTATTKHQSAGDWTANYIDQLARDGHTVMDKTDFKAAGTNAGYSWTSLRHAATESGLIESVPGTGSETIWHIIQPADAEDAS